MRALVLAGGFPQIALIEELHSRGIYVILADWNAEPVAKRYADKYYRVSTLNVEDIKKVAINEKVDFVITVCTDQALLTVAKVSEELNLPCYIDYQTALKVTNKQYMKELFVRNGIPTAKHIILDVFDKKEIMPFRFPLITKPVDCNSSKGVKIAYNVNELEKFFYEAKELSRTKTAIIEEYIAGEEITVDAYVEDGKAIILSTSISEKIKENDKFVIFRTLNPGKPELLPKIQVVVQQIAEAFNLKNTPMLIQMLTDGDDVYVIEFSARTGGGVKHLLIKEVSGFNVIKAVVDLTLGKRPVVERKARSSCYLVNEFIYCRPGTFDHLEGFEEAKKQGTIADYYLFKWKGAEFDTISNSGDRVAGFTIVGNSLEELNQKHNSFNSSFSIVDTDGSDMARHDLLTEIEPF